MTDIVSKTSVLKKLKVFFPFSNTMSNSNVKEDGGLLILGGSDKSLFQGQILRFPVIDNSSWTVNLTK